MPYLDSAMRAAHESHLPILTPTFVAFEDDPASFVDADALMVGAWLLAAPVTRDGAREVEVYLPRGPEEWRDEGLMGLPCSPFSPSSLMLWRNPGTPPLDRSHIARDF